MTRKKKFKNQEFENYTKLKISNEPTRTTIPQRVR